MSFKVSITEEATACSSDIKGSISSGSSGVTASSGKDNFAKFRGLRAITHGQGYICRYPVFQEKSSNIVGATNLRTDALTRIRTVSRYLCHLSSKTAELSAERDPLTCNFSHVEEYDHVSEYSASPAV